MKKAPIQSANSNLHSSSSAYQIELLRLRTLITHSPENLNLWFDTGKLHSQNNNPELAIKWFNDIVKTKLKISPLNIVFVYNVYRGLAKAYLEVNQPLQTIEYLKKSIKLITDHPSYLSNCSISLAENNKELGMLMLNNNQLSDALGYFSEALNYLGERTPDDVTYIEYKELKVNAHECRAITYERLFQYENALNDYIKLVKEYESDDTKFSRKICLNYFKIGHVYHALNNKIETERYFSKSLTESEERNIELDISALSEISRFFAVYYYDLGDYTKSIDHATTALKIENNVLYKANIVHLLSKSFIALGWFNDNKDLSELAVQLTEPIKNTNPHVFAESCLINANALYLDNQKDEALSRCKLAITYFQNAYKVCELQLSNSLKLSIALAHQLKGNILLEKPNPEKTDFNQALKSYKVVLAEKSLQNDDMYLKKGYCFFKLDDFNKAIGPFTEALNICNKNPCKSNELNRVIINIWLAKIYYNKNEFDKVETCIKDALSILNDANDHKMSNDFFICIDREFEIAYGYLLLADTYSKQGKFVEAEKCYAHGLKDLRFQTPNNYREYAACLIHLKQPDKAILCYIKTIKNHPNHPSFDLQYAYLSLGKLYFENNYIDNADKYAEDNFLLALPYFKQHKNRIALNTSPPVSLIDSEDYFFIHICLGDIYLKRNHWSLAQEHYHQGMKKSSFQTAKNYYSLGFISSQLQNLTEATRYFDLAFDHLKNNPDSAITFEQISMAKEEMFTKNYNHTKPTHIILPPLIKKIFDELTSIYPNVYLGGSTIHTLLLKKPLNNKQDLDFLALGVPTNRLIETLKFKSCIYKCNLYQKKEEGFSIDCYVNTQQEEYHPEKNLENSDFTVSSLYCDQDGRIYDQSGRGLDDFFAQRLSTIHLNASTTFQNDPACLLRGIKLMLRGFKPTHLIDKAMKEYAPLASGAKTQHLKAITRDLLKTTDSNRLVVHLSFYGLLEKLFGISQQLTTEDALFQLKSKLSLPTTPVRISRTPHSFLRTSSSPTSPLLITENNTYKVS